MKHLIFLIFTSMNLFSIAANMELRVASLPTINQDLNYISKAAKNNIVLKANYRHSLGKNMVHIECKEGSIHLNASGEEFEKSSTIYFGLHKLGYLFPHPRISIYPKYSDVLNHCNRIYEWEPSFKYRGFHFHTMHPNEWVQGFLLGSQEISNDSVRWLARNFQNTLSLTLLRSVHSKKIFKRIKDPFQLAKDLGIYTGVNLGFAQQQQKSYRLIRPLRLLLRNNTLKQIEKKLKVLLESVDLSFLSLNAGTSEFTKTDYALSIEWMNKASEVINKYNKQMFMTVHVSSNQNDPIYGNFNFLPQFAKPEVGIWPHTTMFYSLYDKKAPMYGNVNFNHILDFAIQEKDKRATWYYPETSYFIALDIDIPLVLTDYLIARTEDMRNLHEEKIEGHINFTTGQEIGYWLFDWNVALQANKNYDFDPKITLKLLKEDISTWDKIISFQSKYIKDKRAISILTGSTFPDEISKKHRILERNTLVELYKDSSLLDKEIKLLNQMYNDLPDVSLIQNEELKILMTVTLNRISHALYTRNYIKFEDKSKERRMWLEEAKSIREESQMLIQDYVQKYSRYPEAFVFDRGKKNPTSYSWGYGWAAKELHFWKREEQMIRLQNFSPFFMNIYNLWKTIF